MKDIEQASDPTRGEVRIGATEPLAVILAEIINRLSAKHPRITYKVIISDTTTLLRELRERNIDVAITRWTHRSAANDLAAEPLYNNPLGVLVHRRHPLLRHKRLELGDLMDERWTLSPPDSFLGQIVDDEFRRRKLSYPKATVTSISIYMRLTLLASGRYLTMLPVSMLRHPADKAWLRALPVKFQDSPGSVASITLKRRRARGAVELFQRASREVASSL